MLRNRLRSASKTYDAVVCVQGLGFVGAAMAVVVAAARRDDGTARYLVVGVDQDTESGRARIDALGQGNFPFPNADPMIQEQLQQAVSVGNLYTTHDESVFQWADVALVDVQLDVDFSVAPPEADLGSFKRAIRTLGQHMPLGSLIIVETTVPPGTTVNVVAPTLASCLQGRGLPYDAIHVAHSYERVMPGPNYFDSIAKYWRAFAGMNSASAAACSNFLGTIIDVSNFPLTELSSPTSSETAIILENSYRSVNIALMEEWGHFAEAIGIDLFEVVQAIRVRPTHSNMRQPGLGVGGYCLTKDPYSSAIALEKFFPKAHVDFPLTMRAMKINEGMPQSTAIRLRELLGGDLNNKHVLVMGASYRGDVGDTRYSPSETLTRLLMDAGANIRVHDPLAATWDLPEIPIEHEVPDPIDFDAVIFATPHSIFRSINLASWFGHHCPWILDSNNVLSDDQRHYLTGSNADKFVCVGRGKL